MVISTSHFLILSALLFAIGAAGVLLRRNGISTLLGIEIMLNAVNISFVAFARQHGNLEGQVFVFFVMAVAAAEVAVGLALLILHFGRKRTLDVDTIGVRGR